jgi:hypothetical protein
VQAPRRKLKLLKKIEEKREMLGYVKNKIILKDQITNQRGD